MAGAWHQDQKSCELWEKFTELQRQLAQTDELKDRQQLRAQFIEQEEKLDKRKITSEKLRDLRRFLIAVTLEPEPNATDLARWVAFAQRLGTVANLDDLFTTYPNLPSNFTGTKIDLYRNIHHFLNDSELTVSDTIMILEKEPRLFNLFTERNRGRLQKPEYLFPLWKKFPKEMSAILAKDSVLLFDALYLNALQREVLNPVIQQGLSRSSITFDQSTQTKFKEPQMVDVSTQTATAPKPLPPTPMGPPASALRPPRAKTEKPRIRKRRSSVSQQAPHSLLFKDVDVQVVETPKQKRRRPAPPQTAPARRASIATGGGGAMVFTPRRSERLKERRGSLDGRPAWDKHFTAAKSLSGKKI